MAQIRNMQASEAGRVRDLWLQGSAEVGAPLPEASARQILANLKQYPAHQTVRCFVAEEQGTIIGFLTCSVMGHPVMPGLSGEIEELYVQPHPQRHEIKVELVGQAVKFMQALGAGSIHARICIGDECPEEAELRAFWQSLGWVNDTTSYAIYSNIPGDPALQRIWDKYLA